MAGLKPEQIHFLYANNHMPQIIKRALRLFQQGFYIFPHPFRLPTDVAGVYYFPFIVDTCRT